jgi:hypothetical protein
MLTKKSGVAEKKNTRVLNRLTQEDDRKVASCEGRKTPVILSLIL